MSTVKYNKEDVLGYECKHVVYVKNTDQDSQCYDSLIVKENVHLKTGEVVPNLRRVDNYQRDFYITKEHARNHTDKKESELSRNLQKHTCTQAEMPSRIAKALNANRKRLNLRHLARSPYLYGADITTPTLLKAEYLAKFPDLNSESTLGVIDIETDVIHGTEQILTMSYSYRSTVVLVVNRWFLRGTSINEEHISKAFTKYLGDYETKRNIKLEIYILDTPGQCVAKIMSRAHDTMPDFLTAWNMSFDIPRMIDALEKERYDVAAIFSHPSIPPGLRYAEWSPAPKVKVTASGKTSPVPPGDRWHKFICASASYWVDAMVLRAMIRKAGGITPLGLDAVLEMELGLRKLNFKEADGYEKLAWHEYMQAEHKVLYCIYNIWDTIGVEEIDEVTKDFSITLPQLCEFSEYGNFSSTPTQLADDLHFFYLDLGEVIASKSDQMETELDALVISMKNHIVTLATHQNIDNGIKPFTDFPELRSLIRRYVSDLDVKSAYPFTEIFLNISRATTILELCRIEGVSEEDRRIIGLNITGSNVNSAEFCARALGAPTLDELLTIYDEGQWKNIA